MSQQPGRQEKNCLNCGATVAGRYCQTCGQENILPKQSAWGLITHFVYDLLHFDGKFFLTVGRLFRRPGLVPKEYVAGKRQSYLDPIRMYLFTSAVFFLFFFSFGFNVNNSENLVNGDRTLSKIERLEYASILYNRQRAGKPDSLLQRQLNFLLDTTLRIKLKKPNERPDNDSSFLIRFHEEDYLLSVSADQTFTFRSSSGWMDKTFNEKLKAYKRKFADDDRAMVRSLIDTVLHKVPYLLFVSLPFFALILKLLYLRRKQFYYSDHAVFTLYHYILTFLLLVVFFLLSKLASRFQSSVLDWAMTLVFLSGGVYLFLAMKRFYGQGYGKTTVKFLLLNLLAFVVVLLLLVAFFLLSIFQL